MLRILTIKILIIIYIKSHMVLNFMNEIAIPADMNDCINAPNH